MKREKPVALITGAGRGIGRGIVIELAKIGYNISAVDILYSPEENKTGLFEVKQRVEELSGGFFPIGADISSLEDHDKILNSTLEAFGRIDVLVNNAGVAPAARLDILETTPESYDRLLAINARGPFFLTQKIANYMMDATKTNSLLKPSIIFISSISAYVSSPARSEYCISKAAISQMARIYADRLAIYGINVYEIRPGIIQTDMTVSVKEKYDDLIANGLIPQNRWGFPEDVGKAVASLAKGDFAYSTGMVVEVSGGMNICRL
ncbi:3-ketoacyl-ACP reductase [candidate division KSB1 bacterium]|nr:3-ketoacyl-ACP reductase [candidate division KSB1 bacterium]